jgi:hypothetical protein
MKAVEVYAVNKSQIINHFGAKIRGTISRIERRLGITLLFFQT